MFTSLLVVHCVVGLVDNCMLPVSRSPEYRSPQYELFKPGDLSVYCSLVGLKLRATAELSWWEMVGLMTPCLLAN